MYDASISASKSMCEPGQCKCKYKKKKRFPSSYACAGACVAPVHTYFFLHLCLCLGRTCEPAFTELGYMTMLWRGYHTIQTMSTNITLTTYSRFTLEDFIDLKFKHLGFHHQ